jgi:hypothetical protein
MKPTGVRLHRADGSVINCELVHLGYDEEGMDNWEIAGVDYRPGDHLTIEVMPAKTGISFRAPLGFPRKEEK